MLKPSRLSFVVSLGLLALLAWSWRRPHAAEAQAFEPGWLLIQGSDVFDGVRPQLQHSLDVLIHEGMIVSVGPGGSAPVPAGTQIIPGRGLTLMPSFTDLAVLPSLQGGFSEDKVSGLYQLALHTKLASGVGCALDINSTVAQAELQAGLDQPRLKFAGPALISLEGWRPGPRGDAESPVIEVSDGESMRRAISVLHSARAGLVFICMENAGLEDPAFSAQDLRLLGELARAQQLPVLAYAEHETHALRALEAGPCLLLGPMAFEAVSPGLAAAMKKSHCAYAPGLNSLLAQWPWPNGLARLESFSEALILSPNLRSSLSDPERLGRQRKIIDESGASKDLAMANLRALAAADVNLGLAGFSGLPGAPHGLATRSEIAFMLEAGLPLPDVMRLATSGSAAIAGFKNNGQVRAGYNADLLLVKGDPLSDPVAHRRVRLVLRAGKAWIPRDLRNL